MGLFFFFGFFKWKNEKVFWFGTGWNFPQEGRGGNFLGGVNYFGTGFNRLSSKAMFPLNYKVTYSLHPFLIFSIIGRRGAPLCRPL